jgi:alpha-L-fucosidase
MLLFFTPLFAAGQQTISPDSIREKMKWFADAKLGIFIHWGIYAVDGVDESWSFYNNKITYPDYMKQLKGFTASKYDPAAWADLIEASGARYAVITTKHHDGVALYNSKAGSLNVATRTPARRDLLTPFYQELRKRKIKCGAYYSLIDWSHPDYPGFRKDSARFDIKSNEAKWKKFQEFFQTQLKEIGHQFNPDLWWFDGDWEHSADEWQAGKVRNDLLRMNPKTIINGRLQGYGDYETPEQNFPVSRPAYPWWELCMTTNNNWGFQPHDTNWKTPYEVITIFADVVSYGGNLLLDIGPKEDGTIPAEQINILKELGDWNKKHGEAIFSTLPGLPAGHFYGPSTLSKDSSTLFLFLTGKTSGELMLKGLKNAIRKITVVGQGTSLKHKVVGKISWSPVPGLVYINVPFESQDKYVTVLKLELEGTLDLYRGKGGLQ